MSDTRLRKLVVSALEDTPMTLEHLEKKVRMMGWRFKGIAAFALIGVVSELTEEGYVRLEKDKYLLVPGREKAAPRIPRQKKAKSRDLPVLMLAKKWVPDFRDQQDLADAIQGMIDRERKKKTVLLVGQAEGGITVEVQGSNLEPAFGTSILEALGNLLVLHTREFGFDIQQKE